MALLGIPTLQAQQAQTQLQFVSKLRQASQTAATSFGELATLYKQSASRETVSEMDKQALVRRANRHAGDWEGAKNMLTARHWYADPRTVKDEHSDTAKRLKEEPFHAQLTELKAAFRLLDEYDRMRLYAPFTEEKWATAPLEPIGDGMVAHVLFKVSAEMSAVADTLTTTEEALKTVASQRRLDYRMIIEALRL